MKNFDLIWKERRLYSLRQLAYVHKIKVKIFRYFDISVMLEVPLRSAGQSAL